MNRKKTKIKKDFFKTIRGKQSDTQNTGITLISLIITIIVLLILAGITINMVLGENGLFNKAKTSVAKYENAQAKENTTLAEFEEYISQFSRSGEVTDSLIDAIVDKMYEKQVSIVPAGTIISCIRSSMPAGYLACDGSKYNVSDYPVLYAALKDLDHTGWAAADWTTEFTVPDLRGEFLRGTGTNGHTNQGNGTTVGKHQDATTRNVLFFNANEKIIQMRGVTASNWNTDHTNQDSYIITRAYTNMAVSGGAAYSTHTFDLSSAVTSRPTNTSVLYCIKY